MIGNGNVDGSLPFYEVGDASYQLGCNLQVSSARLIRRAGEGDALQSHTREEGMSPMKLGLAWGTLANVYVYRVPCTV